MRKQGISSLDLAEYPHEYYSLAVVAKATGLSLNHLRKSNIPKYRFGNTLYIKVEQVNRYIEDPMRICAR